MNSKFSQFLLVVNLLFTIGLATAFFHRPEELPDFSDDILRVRGLVVVDPSGVERVILGSPLPDPTFHGYRIFRGEHGAISGMLLFDSEGQERGGYVTDDSYGNVFLTLDSKTQQNALFIADPLGGAALQVWGRNGNKISLAAGDEDIYMDVMQNHQARTIETHEE